MNNLNSEIGLQVIRTYPATGMANVNIHESFEIEFSEDLDALTIGKNIRLYQSVGGVFTTIGKLEDLSKFVPIETKTSYKDRVVKLQPLVTLNVDKEYVLITESMTIMSITGKQMLQHSVCLFHTEVKASPIPVNLISPGFGDILSTMPELIWSGDAPSYVIQISKEQTFSTLIFDKSVQATSLLPDSSLNADEGIYYWRVKPENGVFAPYQSFFVKPTETMPVSHEDAPERIVGLPWDDDLEVLELFPEDGFSNVGLNLKSMYIKVNGLYSAEDVAFNMSYVSGQVNDQNDIGTINDHGDVKGQWTVVRDTDNNCTYFVFALDKL